MQTLLPQMEPKNKPRLMDNERKRIERLLDDGWTPYRIAMALGRPPKTVMREIVNRAIRSLKGSVGRINNRCVHRFGCEGNRIANLFYCNPGASYQKPHVERNHEGIRLILPKGNCYLLPTSFDNLTQKDVDTMMSHVNSYLRPVLGDRAPYDVFTQKLGTDVADLFNIRRIPANDIVLKPKLLGIEQKVRAWVTEETNPKDCTNKTK